jgi:hypothetical protein
MVIDTERAFNGGRGVHRARHEKGRRITGADKASAGGK